MNAYIDQRLAQMVAEIPRGIETKEADLEGQIRSIKEEILSRIEAKSADSHKEIAALQTQLDALDLKMVDRESGGGYGSVKSLGDTLKENESLERLVRDRRGRAVIEIDAKQTSQMFERKTTMTTGSSASLATTGVLQFERLPGITTEARQAPCVRDVLSSSPTSFPVIDFVKVSTPLSNAQPQVEGSTKFENTLTFTSASVRVQTLATFIKISTQLLEDLSELADFLRTGLSFYVKQAEDVQVLSGDGTGNNLNGLITQATAFNTSLLSNTKGWNQIDILLRAQQQIAMAKEVPPTFAILNPVDWFGLRALKDGYGHYLLGGPQDTVEPNLFGLRIVPTTNIAAGTFLVGSGDPAAAVIKDRMGLVIDISTEDGNNFSSNLATVRAEERIAVVCRRPGSFITGSFTSSPA